MSMVRFSELFPEVANRETRTPMRVDTRIQIASMSKLFTQIAIRQLAEAGRLSLGDTVGRFLPDYPNPVVRSRVTIEQLLRHRSGVGSFFNVLNPGQMLLWHVTLLPVAVGTIAVMHVVLVRRHGVVPPLEDEPKEAVR